MQYPFHRPSDRSLDQVVNLALMWDSSLLQLFGTWILTPESCLQPTHCMCGFDESSFPTIGPKSSEEREFTFDQPKTKKLHNNDPYNGQGEVRRILHLHRIANNVPDAFAPTEKVSRSDINDALNVPAAVQVCSIDATFSKTRPTKRRERLQSKKTPGKKRTCWCKPTSDCN